MQITFVNCGKVIVVTIMPCHSNQDFDQIEIEINGQRGVVISATLDMPTTLKESFFSNKKSIKKRERRDTMKESIFREVRRNPLFHET